MPETAANLAARAATGPTRRAALCCALLATPLAWRPVAAAATADGAPARWPALELRGAGGVPLPPPGALGRITYVDFWASWCAPCRLSFPWMSEMHERWAGAGLRIVAINLDRREADARRFLAQHPVRFEVAFDPDGESARRLDVRAMPTSLAVGRDGAILFSHGGFRPEDRPALEQRLRDALA